MSVPDPDETDQRQTPSLSQVRRAENIQIVVATGVLSGYITLSTKNMLPRGVIGAWMNIFALFSLIFLGIKLTVITINTHTTSVSLGDFPSIMQPVVERWPSLPFSLVDIDRIMLPVIYIFSFWGIVLLYMGDLLYNKVASIVDVNILGLFSNLDLSYAYIAATILVLLVAAVRFAVAYNATMTQLKTASTGGDILLASGRSGSEAEIQLRNPSTEQAISADNISMVVNKPTGVSVDIGHSRIVDESNNEWRPIRDIPPGRTMNMSLTFTRERGSDANPSEITVTTRFKDEYEQVEVFEFA